ncbi:hypothetical protein [Actinomadura geliboluensis]|uniref:hypothetical protein n=1 Tax=Actinomadura geliboluensis TaxID=882440 RepID=UPI0026188F04|nr:hypothetical protein [Actinomadura geliboluensis]
MQFEIGMERLAFLVADLPEQRRDFESKELRTDEEGRPLFQARLLVMDGQQSAPIRVGLVGDPGVGQGAWVRPVGLALNVVDRKGDSVTWWTAERLDPAAAPGVPDSGGSRGAGGGKAAASAKAGE